MTRTNYIVGAICLVVGVLVGYLLFSQNSPEQVTKVGAATNSTTGATFNTAKVAAIAFAPATGTATNTSILNTDATDRYVTSSFAACNTVATSKTAYSGTGLAQLLFQMSTSTTASPNAIQNTNFLSSLVVGTTTDISYQASTTLGVLGTSTIVWPTGTYLNIYSNATNTAVCTTGVYYLPS